MQRRNTIQKELVLDAVLSLKCHATADEVYNFVRVEHSNISKNTVYRNLNLLTEAGSIRKIQIPGEADRFDHLPYDHYHFRCLKCNKIYDVDMAVIPDMESRINNNNNGFVFLGCDVIFKGICSDCNNESEKAKSIDTKEEEK